MRRDWALCGYWSCCRLEGLELLLQGNDLDINILQACDAAGAANLVKTSAWDAQMCDPPLSASSRRSLRPLSAGSQPLFCSLVLPDHTDPPHPASTHPQCMEEGMAENGKSGESERVPTHISDLIYSSRFSTFCLASAWSCGTNDGPTSLYTVLWDFRSANSFPSARFISHSDQTAWMLRVAEVDRGDGNALSKLVRFRTIGSLVVVALRSLLRVLGG